MKKASDFPKTITKTVRYIKQDAPLEDLEAIHLLIKTAIDRRKQQDNRTSKASC
ncbi:hypothetical protein [Alkalihalobacterium elongatum]|uniref:hypothetical protein n=1 Tax=Alkalihalobacterium elongatum TaxID=2675466 RepID=UPI001C1FED7E|nr:hypothetical protein [Alkalihalobacterium elongatum]